MSLRCLLKRLKTQQRSRWHLSGDLQPLIRLLAFQELVGINIATFFVLNCWLYGKILKKGQCFKRFQITQQYDEMKAKNVYQYCLVLCGLFLALSGIACLIVASLLSHDPDLKPSQESKSRTYATQYWLGLPVSAWYAFVLYVDLITSEIYIEIWSIC